MQNTTKVNIFMSPIILIVSSKCLYYDMGTQSQRNEKISQQGPCQIEMMNYKRLKYENT